MKNKLIVMMALALLLMVKLTAVTLEKGSGQLNKALIEHKDDKELLPVIIRMKEQNDAKDLYRKVRWLDKQERREVTIQALKKHSDTSQEEIKKYLNKLNKSEATDIKYLWITNIIGLKASVKTLQELDKRKDIESLEYDPMVDVLIYTENAYDKPVREGEREIAYNVEITKAADVWELGYYGEGAVVAVIDSGVNYDHEDLKNQMWISEKYPKHGYNFVRDNDDPKDDNGHGTHCAGTVAGNGNSGIKTGMAPGSKIMALKVLDSGGRGDQVKTIQSVEFAVENGADVLSISLGWVRPDVKMRASWRNTMDNVLSAGVVASVAAGNEGPGAASLRTPADVPPPWLHPDQTTIGDVSGVITVGATDRRDHMANFSSRGPATWISVPDYYDFQLNPGIGLIKPDIVAPGVDVNSLSHVSNTGYRTMEGTSMAAPCVAGIIALLISKSSYLVPEEVCQLIQEQAMVMAEQKNNASGAGRIDALNSVKMIDNYPRNEAKQAPLSLTFRWHTLFYDNYFFSLGTDNPPTNVVQGYETTEKRYELEQELEYDTTYYWRVDYEVDGQLKEGEVWSFQTIPTPHENFDSGDFELYDWKFTNTGNDTGDWEISDKYAFSGKYSAGSTNHGNNSTSMMFVTMEILEEGEISFYRKVSSELGFDALRFYIDNSVMGEWSGELDWKEMSYVVYPGIRTFRWMYSKDSMNSHGEDRAWIDDITFPAHPSPPVKYIPRDIQCSADFENINLSWEIDINEDINPVQFTFMGVFVYRSIDESEFIQAHGTLIKEMEFSEPFDRDSTYQYYIVAVYRDMGKFVNSDPSEIVEYRVNPALPAPLIEPAGGEYFEPVEVVLELQEEPEALIYYTLDGTEPNRESSLYQEAFIITESTILKARGYKEGCLPGEVAEAEYCFSSSVEQEFLVPLSTSLKVFPNPVSLSTTSRNDATVKVEYSLKTDYDSTEMNVYNIRGQLVKQLPINSRKGMHHINWNLKNENNKNVGSGLYFIRLSTQDERIDQRIMIIK